MVKRLAYKKKSIIITKDYACYNFLTVFVISSVPNLVKDKLIYTCYQKGVKDCCVMVIN